MSRVTDFLKTSGHTPFLFNLRVGADEFQENVEKELWRGWRGMDGRG